MAEPQPKFNLVHFSLKICNLVATILVIFHWGNCSKVVCFSHMRNFSQFKGGGHGPSGPMVNTPMDKSNKITARQTSVVCCYFVDITDPEHFSKTTRLAQTVTVDYRLKSSSLPIPC